MTPTGRRLDIHIVDDERVFELRAQNSADCQRWMQLLSANRKSFRRAMHAEEEAAKADSEKQKKFWKVKDKDEAADSVPQRALSPSREAAKGVPPPTPPTDPSKGVPPPSTEYALLSCPCIP